MPKGSDPGSEERRQEIYQALADEQDLYQARQRVAHRFGISEAQLPEIEREMAARKPAVYVAVNVADAGDAGELDVCGFLLVKVVLVPGRHRHDGPAARDRRWGFFLRAMICPFAFVLASVRLPGGSGFLQQQQQCQPHRE
jgi:hypothetical protein